MDITIGDIIKCFDIIEQQFNIRISFHSFSCMRFIAEYTTEIGRFNSHCNPHCIRLKSDPEYHKKCVEYQHKLVEKSKNGLFFEKAPCGLEQCIVPITAMSCTLGIVIVNGYQTQKSIKDALILLKPICSALGKHMYDYREKYPVLLPKNNVFSEIIAYITVNYTNKISVGDIAVHCHCSESYINHIFKKQTGTNISQYINRMRIDKAKELLNADELSVSEIGYASGFSEPNYFTNVFKKQTGMSPKEYRARKTLAAQSRV